MTRNRSVGQLDQSIEVEFACYRDLRGAPRTRSLPQLRGTGKRLDRRGEEVLALVEPDDRLEPCEQTTRRQSTNSC